MKSVPLRYDFKIRYYGPYSEGLWGTLCVIKDLGLIHIHLFGYGYIISDSKDAGLEKFLKVSSMPGLDESVIEYQESCRDLLQLINQHQQGGIWYLELLGMTHFIRKMLALYKHSPPDEEVISAVKGLKYHLNDKDIKQVLAIFRENYPG